MKNLKFMAICVACAALAACGGGGGSSGGGGVGPTPTPSVVATGVNIGNVATIPLGNGGGSTSAIVTNNYSSQLVLLGATYTLFNSTGALSPQNASNSGSPVDASLCSIMQAKGTCSLLLKAASGIQGQYLVTLNFKNISDGKTYTTSQLISYSTTVPVNANGIQMSAMNNTLFNLPGSGTTYSVPFVLTRPMSNLTASSLYNNPAFAPTISCNGSAPYPAGTSCTLFVKVSQTGNAQVISGNITVSSLGSSAQVKAQSLSIKGTTSYLFNIPVTVIQTNSGNLVTSAINVIVNPASSTQTITLFNNGNTSITGITINGATPTAIANATSCTSGPLTANSSCTFTVSAPSITQNAQAAVVINYTSNATNNSIAFNVVYIVPASTAGMSMTASGNLNNTVINTTNNVNIAVTNTGTANLSNITFSAVAGLPTGMSYDTVNSTCKTDGTQTLNVGQSCTLILSYNPTSTTVGTPSVTIREAATYVDPSGSSQSYTAASVTISYTAIAAQAFVYISPNYVAYGIRADNSDTATQTFVIVNASPVSTTVTAESLANPPVSGYTSIGGTCSFPQTLTAAPSAGESCTVIAQFGPTSSTISTTSQMTATYITSGTSTASAFSNLSFTSSPAALVSISNIVESGGSGSAPTFTFTNSPVAPQIQFTITYQNIGTESATNFNVALNTLPIGWYPVTAGTTCSIGGGTGNTLAPSGTCDVVFAAESTGLYNSYSLNGSLSFNLPGWSFIDASTGLNTNSSPTFGVYGSTANVTANPLATAIESPVPTTWTGASAGSSGVNNLTFVVSGGTAASTTIKIESTGFAPAITYGVGSGTGALTGSCVVTGASGSCTIPVNNLANTPVTTYNFFYTVSPAGSSSGIVQSGSFAYTN